MHEMGIAMQILDIALASVPSDLKDAKVEQINLKVGKLSAIVPASLTFCFDIIAKETPLSDAKLHIEEVPVTAACNDCNASFTITGPSFSCQQCESANITLISGQELEIRSIEIKEPS